MRERSLVAFTVLGQAAAGLMTALAAVVWAGGGVPDAGFVAPLLVVGALLLTAGGAATLHLGSSRNAWRAMTGLGSSWLSREIVLAVVFGAVWLLALVLCAAGLGAPALRRGILTAAALPAIGMVYAMARVYRLRTVPVWDTVLTTTGFLLTAAVLGSLAAALALAVAAPGPDGARAIQGLVWVAMVGILTELVMVPVAAAHATAARRRSDPGLRGDPPGPWTTRGRAALLVAGLIAAAGALFMATVGVGSVGVVLVAPTLAGALVTSSAAEVVGRAAFYAGYARVGM